MRSVGNAPVPMRSALRPCTDEASRKRKAITVEYGSPAPWYTLILAMVSGALLATGHYVGGTIVAGLAVLIFALWRYAESRGDDARHTIV